MYTYKIKLTSIILTTIFAIQTMAAPIISHEPSPAGVPGKPLTVIVNIDAGEDVPEQVWMHYTTSTDITPTKAPMRATGVGAYYGTIPARATLQAEKVHYYFEVSTEGGDWGESGWYVVNLKNAPETISKTTREPKVNPSTPGPVQQEKEGNPWFWPAVIGGGALAIVGILALSDSGGGGSDDGGAASGGGTTSCTGENAITPPAVIVSRQNEFILPPDAGAPIDITDQLNGRTITQIQIDFSYDAVDGLAERFFVDVGGNPVFSETTESSGSETIIVENPVSPVVSAGVNVAGYNEEGTASYSWSIRATYCVE